MKDFNGNPINTEEMAHDVMQLLEEMEKIYKAYKIPHSVFIEATMREGYVSFHTFGEDDDSIIITKDFSDGHYVLKETHKNDLGGAANA